MGVGTQGGEEGGTEGKGGREGHWWEVFMTPAGDLFSGVSNLSFQRWRHRGHMFPFRSGSPRNLAHCVRRRQDDNCAPGPPDPSLRNHRNRQRELALQTPRLSAPRLAPVGKQAPPTHATPALVKALRDARGTFLSLPGQVCPKAGERSFFLCRSGVPIACRLIHHRGV